MRARRFHLASFALPRVAALAAAALLATACGGAQDKPPGPLARHFDESFIAQFSVDQQQDVIRAQGEYDVAKREQAKAVADEREAATMLDVAKNEQGAARLDEKSAQTRKDAADKSADQNRINDATKELRGAELARRAAEERVAYLTSYIKWLHTLVRYTQENTFAKEATLELAEARLAKSHNIQPKGFRIEDYENQEAERRSRTNTAKGKADAAKAGALDGRTKWLAIQGEADKTLGKKSDFPDPMGQAMAQPGPASSTGGGGYTIGSQGGAASDKTVPVAEDPTKRPPPPPTTPEPTNGSGAGSGSGNP